MCHQVIVYSYMVNMLRGPVCLPPLAHKPSISNLCAGPACHSRANQINLPLCAITACQSRDKHINRLDY